MTCQTTRTLQWVIHNEAPSAQMTNIVYARRFCRGSYNVQSSYAQHWRHRHGCKGEMPPKTSLSLTSCPRLRADNPCLPDLRFPPRPGSRFPLHLQNPRCCLSKVSSYSTPRLQPMPPHNRTPSWSWYRRMTAWGSNSGYSPKAHRSRPFRRTPPQGSRPDRLPSPLTGTTSRIHRWGVCGSLTSPRTRTTS